MEKHESVGIAEDLASMRTNAGMMSHVCWPLGAVDSEAREAGGRSWQTQARK